MSQPGDRTLPNIKASSGTQAIYIYILCAYNTYLFFDTGQTSNKVDGWIDRWVDWMIRQSIIIWIGR